MSFMGLVMLHALLLPLVASLATTSNPLAKPGCQARCGDVGIPYPFGIGAGCFRPGFQIYCHNMTAFLPADATVQLGEEPRMSVRVLNITVAPRAHVQMSLQVAHQCFDVAGKETSRYDGRMQVNPLGVYSISSTANELFVLGCSTFVYYIAGRGQNYGGCVAYCDTAQSTRDDRCAGIGCCRVDIPPGLTNTSIRFGDWPRSDLNPCNYAFFVEKNHYVFRSDHLSRTLSPGERWQWHMPLRLDWTIRHDNKSMSCVEVAKSTGYSCISKHSQCVESKGGPGPGYTCICTNGYDGNPYLDNGCTDIDECKQTQTHQCFGKCTNTNGSFDCSCPRGFRGIANAPNGCVKSINIGLIIGLSVSSGPTILLLFVGTKLIIRKLKHQKAQELRKRFFNQNRGELLQQLVSHRSDIAERMIITLKELEKATNNFHQTRKLGGGGHGTVYKGILSDLHVVAIKKSNIVVKREINEFINEVAILSQVNHRNIVKLFGCCLETEVPLLVYEFISNGTLCDHLHKEPHGLITWDNRLRIATEICKALAYLHSAISVPVIHRDIKSANVLLDDAFTAKVSDFGASRYIPRDQSGITTAVQGTFGYLDPTYYYSGRLTEKSDVYSFGVILVELLTRKMPSTYRSSEGDGLVARFVELFAEGKLGDILDPQVMEDGGSQLTEVVALAMSCIQLRAEERPTMRSLEMTFERLQGHKDPVWGDFPSETDEWNYLASRYSSTIKRTSMEKVSRQYSQEEEFVLSANYPR